LILISWIIFAFSLSGVLANNRAWADSFSVAGILLRFSFGILAPYLVAAIATMWKVIF